MSHPRLWVVDPSLRYPEDQGVSEVLGDWPGESRVFRPALSPGDGPTPATGYATDGVVVMGSRASVHDDDPWLGELTAWLAPIVHGGRPLPLLGICFGHQLVAAIAGGDVAWIHSDRRKIVGVERSQLDGSRLVVGPRSLRVVVSHREEVKRVPQGYRIVARRGVIEVDGMEHAQRPTFSFQFHPEAREAFARHAGIDPTRIDAGVRADSQLLLGAFRRLVLESARR